MIAAGIRCTPHKVFYTIIELNEDNSFSLVNQELIIPKSFDVPNKLKYVRKTFQAVRKQNGRQNRGSGRYHHLHDNGLYPGS